MRTGPKNAPIRRPIQKLKMALAPDARRQVQDSSGKLNQLQIADWALRSVKATLQSSICNQYSNRQV
jgi:hypothetical protein